MLENNEILIRLALAAFFGALIGLERERKDWTAGLRTHMMVSVGACLIMMVSAYGFMDVLKLNHITLDPSRVAAQVVSGIGFIGAGTIIFMQRGAIRGLTTAAGLWTVAGIGLATGGGMYLAAAATTTIAIFILWVLKPIENYIFKKYRRMTLKVITYTNIDDAGLLKQLLNDNRLKIKEFSLEKKEDIFEFILNCDNIDVNELDVIVNEFKANEAIKEVFWTK